ncbi:caspase-1-A-like [Hippocampus comes]|uniref:Caspase-1-A-like n=1 Tax=Hippocampus comes TaxID=109280 RepID=A0A3Q2YLM8_HIPCM|nr:PREDICTED: caspase-1-A-like [Hippocampus comes]
MAEELKAVKIEFIENVSLPVIEQLLDHLLHDDVLNSGEGQAIIEAHDTRARRARILIDSVSRKGDEASWKMITYLQQRDPMLFKELGLPTESPQAASEVERQWSTTLIPCKRKFWNARKNDQKIYPVNKESKKNRVALLITNIKFKDSHFDRHGAEVDERNMVRLLRALGYEVVQYTNLTGEEIDKAVIDFSKHSKLKDTDSVFVVIMSHGSLGSVFSVDCSYYAIDNIFNHLGSANCKALLNKPKIIIIQACRGVHRGSVPMNDGANEVGSDHIQDAGPSTSDDGRIKHDGVQFVHKEKDFIALLSSTPDTVSYRHKVDGSFFIRYIVDVVNTCACEEDIEELFRMVMRRFEASPLGMPKQMPTKDRCTLSRRFYLFPGI